MNKTGDGWWIGIFLIRLTSTGHLKWSEACCRHKSRYLIPSCIKLPWRMWAGRQEETRKKGRKEWRLFKHFSSDKKNNIVKLKKKNWSNQICKYESGLYKYRGTEGREKRINTWWMKEYSVLQQVGWQNPHFICASGEETVYKNWAQTWQKLRVKATFCFSHNDNFIISQTRIFKRFRVLKICYCCCCQIYQWGQTPNAMRGCTVWALNDFFQAHQLITALSSVLWVLHTYPYTSEMLLSDLLLCSLAKKTKKQGWNCCCQFKKVWQKLYFFFQVAHISHACYLLPRGKSKKKKKINFCCKWEPPTYLCKADACSKW